MLDMKFIRDNPDAVKKGAELKGMKVDVDKLLESTRQVRQRARSTARYTWPLPAGAERGADLIGSETCAGGQRHWPRRFCYTALARV